VHTLEAVAREVGPVDVFAGWSMGVGTGGEAVREGGMRPGLFIAVGISADAAYFSGGGLTRRRFPRIFSSLL